MKTETRETKVTDCFSLRTHKDWVCDTSAPGLEMREPPFVLSSSKAVLNAFREQKALRATQSHLH